MRSEQPLRGCLKPRGGRLPRGFQDPGQEDRGVLSGKAAFAPDAPKPKRSGGAVCRSFQTDPQSLTQKSLGAFAGAASRLPHGSDALETPRFRSNPGNGSQRRPAASRPPDFRVSLPEISRTGPASWQAPPRKPRGRRLGKFARLRGPKRPCPGPGSRPAPGVFGAASRRALSRPAPARRGFRRASVPERPMRRAARLRHPWLTSPERFSEYAAKTKE